jgi:hypothetical protein
MYLTFLRVEHIPCRYPKENGTLPPDGKGTFYQCQSLADVSQQMKKFAVSFIFVKFSKGYSVGA